MNPRVTRRTVANLLVFLVVVALVAPFVVYAVPGLVGGEASYIVLTGSMAPAISPNDAVVVGAVEPADIAVGDVITYTRPGLEVPVTHRVVEVVETESGTAFRTMGDANEDPDLQLVPAANVAGEVVLVVPYIGYVVEFVGTPVGFAALVVVPIALLVASEAWAFVSRRRDAGADPAGDDPLALTTATAGDGGRGLLVGAAGFAVAALYAGSLAVGDASPVNVTVAAGAGVIAGFLAYLWATGAGQRGPVVVEGTVAGVDATPQVHVDSPADLVALADGRVVVDRAGDRYLAFGPGVVYTAPIPEPVLETPIPAIRRVADPDSDPEPAVRPAVRRVDDALAPPRPAVRRVGRPSPVTDGGATEANDAR